MAYAFDKILNTMNDKINVFGQQPQGQQGGQPQTQGQGQQGEQKTTTDGDVGSGGGSGSSNGGASATVDNSANANQAAFAAAKAQPMSKFKPFAEVGQKLATNEKALQDEADSYVKAETDKQTYDIANPEIDKAIGGDEDSQSKVGGLVSRTTINPVAKFAPKTNPVVDDIQKFNSEPGLTGYFRSQYGPSYSRGAAQFDIGRLQSDPEFFTNLRGLQGKQQDLVNKAEGFFDPEKGLEKTVTTTGNTRLEASKKAAADYLKKIRGDIEGTNAGELKAFTDELEKIKNDPAYRASKVAGGLSDPGIQTGIQQAIAANPELGKYLTPQAIEAFGLNPADFAKIFDGTVTADNFYDEGEANRFNRINTMLGVGGPGRVAGTAPQAGATFDTEGYLKGVIGKGSAANETANAAARARIKEIRDIAAARRAQALERLKQADYEGWKKNKQNTLVGKYSREGGDLNQLMGVDVNQFFRGVPTEGLTDEDFIDLTQSNDLNTSFEELMDPTRMSSGRFAEGYNPANFTFDEAGYEEALRRLMPTPQSAPLQNPQAGQGDPNWILQKQAAAIGKLGAVGSDIAGAGQQLYNAPQNIANAVTPPKVAATVKNLKKGKVKF